MTESKPGQLSALDPDEIYRQIGLVVVVFQSHVDLLVQTCWLTTDPPYAPGGRRALAGLSFSRLVTKAGKRVDTFVARDALGDTEFREAFLTRFHELLAQCRDLAEQRNRIVHSAYIHLEGGDQLRGIMRSDMSKAADGPDVEFHQELLKPNSFDAVLHDMALAAFGCHRASCSSSIGFPRSPSRQRRAWFYVSA